MLLKQLFEAPEKRIAVVAFGRMNPPTIGHQKLVEKIKSFDGDHYLFLSQTVKPKDNPLPFTEKLRFAKFFFPAITIGHPDVRTPMDMMVMLQNLGYTDIIYVAGSDRVASFDKLLNTYNGTPDKEGNIGYNFNSIKVVSAGERDPDADGAEGMSASKMRAAAKDGDLESFKQGVPQPQLADEMFAAVRKGMGLETEVPAESLQEGWLSKIIQNIPDYHEAVAEVFKILRQSKKYKNQNDSSIEKMAHRIVKDENNKIKPRPGQDYKNDLENMSDEEFKHFYGWSKSAKDSDFAPDADIDIMKDFELWKRLKKNPLGKTFNYVDVKGNNVNIEKVAKKLGWKTEPGLIPGTTRILPDSKPVTKDAVDKFTDKLGLKFSSGQHTKSPWSESLDESIISPIIQMLIQRGVKTSLKQKIDISAAERKVNKIEKQINKTDDARAVMKLNAMKDEAVAELQDTVRNIVTKSTKESVSEDSGYVIDAGSVRSTIISLIAGEIAKTDDIDQLAKWLKMIVGKELRPRGEHRYIITAEDIVHALESCKRHKKKIKEGEPGDALPPKMNAQPEPFPEIPQVQAEPYTTDDGAQISPMKGGGVKLSNDAGTFIWDPQGKPLTYKSPSVQGLQTVHDMRTGNFIAYYKNGGMSVEQEYDKNGNAIGNTGSSFDAGPVSVNKDRAGKKSATYTMGQATTNIPVK